MVCEYLCAKGHHKIESAFKSIYECRIFAISVQELFPTHTYSEIISACRKNYLIENEVICKDNIYNVY